MKVITISAKAEHGKDTAAYILREKFENEGKRTIIIHFADLLKYLCKTIFGWNGVKDHYGRTLLQEIGTERVRKYDPNFWVNFVKQILAIFGDYWDYVLIPDARFPNEIDEIKSSFDCVSLWVYRPDYENHLSEEQRNHPSETALDKYTFDYLVINDGTMPGFTKELYAVGDEL